MAAGLVSVHFVNAMSKPVVAPFRGSEARYVSNPFTVGIPVPGREPMLLDFATSAIAMGKVRVAYNSGKQVPGNVLMDATGEYTDDPAALFPPAGQPGGALVPFAQHKGYALGATDYMTKPFDRDRLRALLAKYGTTGSRRILVVDDDAEHRRRLAQVLEAEGWQVTEAERSRSIVRSPCSDWLPRESLR